MSSRSLRRTLVGLETTPGTGVTVDKALRGKTELKAVVDKVQVDEDVGTLSQPRHYVGSKHAEGKFSQDGIYAEAPYPTSFVLGQETPTPDGAKYEWSFSWPHSTAPTFATYTVEYTDGDDYIVKSKDVFGTKLSITGEAGKSWEYEVDLVGGDVSYESSLSADIPASGCVTSIRMADTNLYLDDAYADIGTCLASGVFINFDWSLSDLNHQKLLAGSLYPVARGNDRYNVELSLTLEVDSHITRGLRDKLLGDDGVAVRIIALNGDDEARIDGWYMVEGVDTLDERDGNNIIEVTLKGEKSCDDDTGLLYYCCDLSAL